MSGSRRTRRRRRAHERKMRDVGLRVCGCCEIIDRRFRDIARTTRERAALRDS